MADKNRLLKSQVIEWVLEELEFWNKKLIEEELKDDEDGMQNASKKIMMFVEMVKNLRDY